MSDKKRKMVSIDKDILQALDVLQHETGEKFDDMADEALRAFLQRRGRPLNVRDALRKSVRGIPANDRDLRSSKSKTPKARR